MIHASARQRRPTWRKLERRTIVLLALASSSCGNEAEPTGTPPTEFTPTHHAIVEGMVVISNEQQLDSVRVGTLLTYWETIPAERQVDALGGTVVDAPARYSYAVLTSSPAAADGIAYIYVYAQRPMVGGALVDSALVQIRPVPLDESAISSEADTLRLQID